MDIINFYLALSAILFCIGAGGFVAKRNAIVQFMCVELMLNAVNLSLVTFSRSLGGISGQIYVVFVMAVAAAEAAVGLAIVISLFRNYVSVDSTDASSLRG